jgi:hypothetical protein
MIAAVKAAPNAARQPEQTKMFTRSHATRGEEYCHGK